MPAKELEKNAKEAARKELQDSVMLAMDWNRADVVQDELLCLGFNVEMVGLTVVNVWFSAIDHRFS